MKKYRIEFLSGNERAARAAMEYRDMERYIYTVTRTDGGERHLEMQGYRGSIAELVADHLGAGRYELEFPFFDLVVEVEEVGEVPAGEKGGEE